MFRFRLANVLHLREYKEKLCLEEVGKCLLQLQQALQKKEEIKKIILNIESDFTASLKGTIISEKVNLYKNYIVHQQNLLEIQEQVIMERRRELEKAREKYFQAMKDKKILDKLKEKQYLRFIQEEEKNEQKFQDELAITTKRR